MRAAALGLLWGGAFVALVASGQSWYAAGTSTATGSAATSGAALVLVLAALAGAFLNTLLRATARRIVGGLVALYEQGMTLAQLGERFGVYHRTVAAHLVRRSVPMRVRGLAEEHTCEAVRLYEGGMTLMEVGLHFGVSQGAVKRAVAAAGATIRPRGRRVAVTE